MLDAILAQLRDTSVIMGIIALVGLLLQKKSAVDVFSGTVKTMIGFMVFNIGSNAMSSYVTIFSDMFTRAFQVNGVVTQVEVATSLALNTYGTEVASVMVLGFVMNLVFAKFTPQGRVPDWPALPVLRLRPRARLHRAWRPVCRHRPRRRRHPGLLRRRPADAVPALRQQARWR